MKILSAKQIRDTDAATIEREPIASINLMERAATVFTEWFRTHYSAGKPVAVVCGKGNNGGDGLVFARLIADWGFQCTVYIIEWSPKGSPDFETNLNRLKSETNVRIVPITEDSKCDFSDYGVTVDAIFGIGLNRPVEGLAAIVIEQMNATANEVCAIDLPSGLIADAPSSGVIVRANHTFSFELPKMAFFMEENAKYTGDWHFGSIKLDRDFIENSATPYRFTTYDGVKNWIKERKRFTHKGTYGHVFTFTGSYGKAGAGILTAKAALRTGCGLVTAFIPQCNYTAFQSTVPEVMVMSGIGEFFLEDLPDIDFGKFTLAIGPGIGTKERTKKVFKPLLEKAEHPLVLDADALNILAADDTLWTLIPKNSILTPHPGEFRRLAGEWENGFQRLEMLQAMAREKQVIIVLKGAYTVVALTDGTIHFNSSGNSGMATAGSGDVLTGIIASLLAQQYSPKEAAILGVYLHGLAGDTALAKLSPESLIAGDLISHISDALSYMRKRR